MATDNRRSLDAYHRGDMELEAFERFFHSIWNDPDALDYLDELDDAASSQPADELEDDAPCGSSSNAAIAPAPPEPASAEHHGLILGGLSAAAMLVLVLLVFLYQPASESDPVAAGMQQGGIVPTATPEQVPDSTESLAAPSLLVPSAGANTPARLADASDAPTRR